MLWTGNDPKEGRYRVITGAGVDLPSGSFKLSMELVVLYDHMDSRRFYKSRKLLSVSSSLGAGYPIEALFQINNFRCFSLDFEWYAFLGSVKVKDPKK